MSAFAILLAAAIQPLWPEGKVPDAQPEQVAGPSQEISKPGFDADGHRMPYLEWSNPPEAGKKNGSCVILISGGGYGCTCDGPGFKPLERKLLDNGVTCVWLWYRVPRPKGLPKHQWAWEDGQRAVRLVRAAAAERGFDPEKIGVLGCSAGSHLSLLLATSSQTNVYAKVDDVDDVPCHVNFAIPMCPAYVLSDGFDCENTRRGEGFDLTLDPLFAFDRKTCPMCFLHGGADPFSPFGSTAIYRRLRKMKIPAEVHIFADRIHGPTDHVRFERAIEFMRQMGYLGALKPEEKNYDRFPGDEARASYEKEEIWPKGRTPDFQPHQCQPYIEWHIPKNLKTKAIQIVYSGGCYEFGGPESFEVTPARRYLNEKGMTVVTMKYRTPRPKGLAKHISAWQDLQRAIRLVRAEAPKRGLDPARIGIMGCSAGGHLTLMGALSSKSQSYRPIDEIDKLSCAVDWAIATYPAYALSDGDENPNSKGGNEDDSRPVPEFVFDQASCPVLFVHGDADGWAAMNSVKCWEQLRRMGIQGELHTLAKRGHCFQEKAVPGTGSYTYLDRIWEFLSEKNFNR